MCRRRCERYGRGTGGHAGGYGPGMEYPRRVLCGVGGGGWGGGCGGRRARSTSRMKTDSVMEVGGCRRGVGWLCAWMLLTTVSRLGRDMARRITFAQVASFP